MNIFSFAIIPPFLYKSFVAIYIESFTLSQVLVFNILFSVPSSLLLACGQPNFLDYESLIDSWEMVA